MGNHIRRFLKEEEGATAIEYALLAGLIAAVIVGSVTGIGTAVDGSFTSVSAGFS